jgi:hypothetical protein
MYSVSSAFPVSFIQDDIDARRIRFLINEQVKHESELEINGIRNFFGLQKSNHASRSRNIRLAPPHLQI